MLDRRSERKLGLTPPPRPFGRGSGAVAGTGRPQRRRTRDESRVAAEASAVNDSWCTVTLGLRSRDSVHSEWRALRNTQSPPTGPPFSRERPAGRGEGCQQTLRQACSQAYPGSARCVQSFDDSLDSASRKTYRISLRSSSLWEPRHPSLKVLQRLCFKRGAQRLPFPSSDSLFSGVECGYAFFCARTGARTRRDAPRPASHGLFSFVRGVGDRGPKRNPHQVSSCDRVLGRFGNDPSAGSPTETLLRLHLPLNVEV